jgi:hypothetical protein
MIRSAQLGDGSVEYVGRIGETVRFYVEFWESGETAAVDITGAVAKMTLRRRVDDSVAALSLTSPSNGLTIDPTLGRITVHITDEQTDTMDGAYVFDVKLEFASGDDVFLCGGTITLVKPVTR